MEVYTGVPKGFSNYIRSAAESYLNPDRRINAIYTKNTETKRIIGRDDKEPVILTALRILSWATVIFPLIAFAIKKLVNPPEYKDANNLIVSPYAKSGDNDRVSGYFFRRLKSEGVTHSVYSALFPRMCRHNMPTEIFEANQPYTGCTIPKGVGIAFAFTDNEDYRSWLVDWIPQQWTGDLSSCFPENVYSCVLAPCDQDAVVNPLNSGHHLSKAFIQMLQSR